MLEGKQVKADVQCCTIVIDSNRLKVRSADRRTGSEVTLQHINIDRPRHG
jgi:hypothetical protein